MLGYLKETLAVAGDGVTAHIAVGGKPPRECVVSHADEVGIVLRWAAFPDTYLFPWSRIEAIVLKA